MAGTYQPDWGSSRAHFRVREGPKRWREEDETEHDSNEDVERKRHRGLNHQKPLTKTTGEMYRFVQDLASDEAILERDTNLGLADEEEDRGDDLANEEAPSEEINPPRPEKLDIAFLNSLIDGMENVCGTVPTTDGLPSGYLKGIETHDKNYTSIFENVFKNALATPYAKAPDSLFSQPMLEWAKVNSSQEIQTALLQFLLHPHVRPFRVRTAIGYNNSRSMPAMLEFSPLETCSESVANMIGVYFLYDESQGIGYCGQSMAIKPDEIRSVGIRQRAQGHRRDIKRAKLDPSISRGTLYAHHRFQEVEKVGVAVLSVFPFPQASMGDAAKHLWHIATLAETIDILLLDCVSREGPPFAHYTALPHGLALRPPHIPSTPFEGLNRALPIRQLTYGGHISSMSWSPRETRCLITIINENEDKVYHHFGHAPIQWQYLAETLREYRILKSIDDIKSVYALLLASANTGLLTCRASRWRFVWKNIYDVKRHLLQNGLVQSPKDGNDMYYHIPALEEGLQTTWNIGDLLRRTGWFGSSGRILNQRFFQRHLAKLLQREVWEGIQEAAPDRLVMKTSFVSQPLIRRTIDVLVHFGEQLLNEDGISTNPPPTPIPGMSPSQLLELWHRVRAQMLADRVPSELILVGGLCYVEALWCTHKRRLLDQDRSKILKPWTYGIPKAAADKAPASLLTSHAQPAEQEGEQQDLCDAEPEMPYLWSSDRARQEALSLTNEFVAATNDFPARADALYLEVPVQREAPAEVGQHRSCTLRILMQVMRKFHQSTFESPDGTYEQFWECLYIGGLDAKWKIGDVERLKQRFEWVLQFVEDGVLPKEAQEAEKLLYETLSKNVLVHSTHPYTLQGWNKSWLNPDLSRAWVKDFFQAQGCLQEIKIGIKRSIPAIAIDGFCDRYGILVAWTWENAMRSYSTIGYLPSPAPELPAPEPPTPEPPTPETTAGPNPEPARPSTPATPESEPDSPDSLSSSPHSSSEDEAAGNDKKGERWTPDEIDYLKELMGANLPRQTRIKKFQARFGREAATIIRQEYNLTEHRAPEQRRDDWTAPQHEYLIELLRTKTTWDQVCAELNARFDKERTKNSISHYAGRNKLGKPVASARQLWNDDHDRYLESLRKANKSFDEISRMFKEELGVTRSADACKRRASVKGFASTCLPFTADEERNIRESMASNLSVKKTCKRLWGEFGTDHPETSIRGKMKSLRTSTVVPAGKRAAWTPQEDRFLQDWQSRNSTNKGLMKAFNDTFGPTHTEGAIMSKISNIKARMKNEEAEDDP